jgi:peptide/nickel transport system substrate-binding protein
VPPWHPLFPKDAAVLPYNIAAAGKLLDSLGWKDSNGDGVRDKNGQPFRFTLMTADYPLNRSVAEVLQSQLKKIGVAAQVRVLEFQTMLAQHKARDFDAVFTSWVLDNFQMASAPEALFHSKLAAVPKSTNRSGVSIPELDRLIDQAARTPDLNAARPIWKQMTEVMQREQPVTFVYWLYELAATNKSIAGVSMDPRGELLTIQQWSRGRR